MLVKRKRETTALQRSTLALLLLGLVYLAVLTFTSLLRSSRFPIPYAVSIFDVPFILVAVGVGYLCLERHRLRQDCRSLFLGASLWLAALLAFDHILTQPGSLGTPTIKAGMAPYCFFLCYIVCFAGIGLTGRFGDQQLPLRNRARLWIGVGLVVVSILMKLILMWLSTVLPSPIVPPGRLTPLAIGFAAVSIGLFGGWALWEGQRKFRGETQDWFAGYLVLATLIWLFAMIGFLIVPFRYAVSWYIAGLARSAGVVVIFIGLLWEQVWLYREAHGRQRDLEALHSAGQALVTCLDPQQIVDAIAREALKVSGAENSILFQLDARSQILRIVSHAGRLSHELVAVLELPVGTSVAGRAVAERCPVWSVNLQVDARLHFSAELTQRLQQENLKALLAIPLLIKSGEVFGALSILYREERTFTDTDIGLLSAFGAQVSVAIENAKAFDQLAHKARHASALQAFGRQLFEATGKMAILNEAVRVTQDLLEADYAGLFLCDPAASCLRLEAGVGWGAGSIGELTVPLSAESCIGHVFLHKESLQVEYGLWEEHLGAPSFLAMRGVQAGLLVPLGGRDQPVGVLGAYYRAPRRFSDEELQSLFIVAHQTVLALEKIHLYTELQANLHRLQETQGQLIQADKLTTFGTLLSGMAHELNSPLSSILLAAQWLQQQCVLSDQARPRLDVIEQEAKRAARLIKDFLVFARRKSPERQHVDMNEAVEATLNLQAPSFTFHNIRVVSDLEPTLPRLWADKHQLQQVFLNLFDNAIQAMKSAHGGGTLTVRSFRHGSEVWVAVGDDGPGISPEHIGRIFDPFFTTKDAGEGTGLGLSLSYSIVEAHGGQLHGENLPGEGACFTVRLPRENGAESVASAAPEPLLVSRRAHILVVDDEENLRLLLADCLSALGHQVEDVATGQEAIARLERQDYDLLTLDLRLPDLDGTEIWRWLVSQRPVLAARVVFITGDIMTPQNEQFLQETGRPVLIKPLAMVQIHKIVDEVLAQNTSYASAGALG